jgi:hypothetical protein
MVQRQGKVFGSIDEIRKCEIVPDEISTLFKGCILLVEGAEVPLKARWKDNEVADTAVEDVMIRLIAEWGLRYHQ